MELKIFWTDFAKNELVKIFSYYRKKAGIPIAQKLIIEIVEEADKLQKQPGIGQQEELLSSSSYNFRYLIFKNYKIIYRVILNEQRVEIYDVFDTRQNPVKIKRSK